MKWEEDMTPRLVPGSYEVIIALKGVPDTEAASIEYMNSNGTIVTAIVGVRVSKDRSRLRLIFSEAPHG